MLPDGACQFRVNEGDERDIKWLSAVPTVGESMGESGSFAYSIRASGFQCDSAHGRGIARGAGQPCAHLAPRGGVHCFAIVLGPAGVVQLGHGAGDALQAWRGTGGRRAGTVSRCVHSLSTWQPGQARKLGA